MDATKPCADEVDMAAFMGFSSFGTLDHPSKKRRFNAHADAVVGSSKVLLSSAAAASLPPKPPVVAGFGANCAPGYTRARQHIRNMDSDLAGVQEENKKVDRIDLGLGFGDGLAIDAGAVGNVSVASTHTSSTHIRGANSYAQAGRGSQGRRGRGGRFGGHRGEADEPWWTDYYDQSFNENPWERLEKEKGLGERGTWLKRSAQGSHGRGRGGKDFARAGG